MQHAQQLAAKRHYFLGNCLVVARDELGRARLTTQRRRAAPILFADHQPEARERASIVTPAQPSPAAVEKCTKRLAVDGPPIMAWHDLIGQLGTLTINEVALPLGERSTIQMLARPTALQQQAFALLGVLPPRVR